MQNFDLKKVPFINSDNNYKSFSLRIAILMEVKGRYLMVVNENDVKFKHPGGHVNTGEFLIQAVKREVKEETGYDLIELPDSQIVFDHVDFSGNIMINGYLKMSIDEKTAEAILSTSPLKSKLFAVEELNEENSWESEIRVIKYFMNL